MLWVDLTQICVIFILSYVFVVYNYLQMTVHISLCFVMHNSVQMTVHIIFGFCHAHLCTNDYPYYFWFLSCTSLWEWLSILFLVFVVHIFVRMTIHIIFGFCHAHLCTNDYPYYLFILSCIFLYEGLSIFSFQCVSVKREYFYVSLLFARINRWGRSPWSLSYQWWVLMCIWL